MVGAVGGSRGQCPSLLNAYPQENMHYIMQPLELDFLEISISIA